MEALLTVYRRAQTTLFKYPVRTAQ